jgi:hypothetical protein
MCNKLDLQELQDISTKFEGSNMLYFSKTFVVVIKTKFDEYCTVEEWSFASQEFYTTDNCFTFDDVIEFRLMKKF